MRAADDRLTAAGGRRGPAAGARSGPATTVGRGHHVSRRQPVAGPRPRPGSPGAQRPRRELQAWHPRRSIPMLATIRHCSLAVRMVLRWPLSRTSADAARGQQRRRGARNNRLASVRCSKRRAKAYLGAICRDSYFLPKTLPDLDPLDLAANVCPCGAGCADKSKAHVLPHGHGNGSRCIAITNTAASTDSSAPTLRGCVPATRPTHNPALALVIRVRRR